MRVGRSSVENTAAMIKEHSRAPRESPEAGLEPASDARKRVDARHRPPNNEANAEMRGPDSTNSF